MYTNHDTGIKRLKEGEVVFTYWDILPHSGIVVKRKHLHFTIIV